MGSFIKFLKESKIEEELNNSEDKYFSINEDGSLEFVDDKDIYENDSIEESDSFDSIFDDNYDIDESEEETADVEKGFGGESYVNLDFPSLELDTVNEKKQEKKKEDSDTLKNLINRKNAGDSDDIDDEIRKFTKYSLSDDGKRILKHGKELTADNIKQILDQKNKESTFGTTKKHYDFDENDELCTVKDGDYKILQKKNHKRFIKILNDIVNGEGIHYRFQNGTSKLLVNTSNWTKDGEEDNVRDKDRFNNTEYVPIDAENREKILSIVNKTTSKKSSDKLKDVIGFENGEFTKNGTPIVGDELQNFIHALNGFGYDTKLLNPKGWKQKTEKFWKCYKISVAGSKIGSAVNFNLPPVITCNKDVPCIKEGCYAIKSYAAYPSARASMNCNLRLLKKDTDFELFKKSMILALTTKTKKGFKFNLCRIHVNGDMFSNDYFNAICEIASECSHVNFWMYTKQYEILAAHTGSIPPNLCVIVSCWGKFNPFDYKDGKYKDLAKKFPLAYLDDGSKESKELNQNIQQILRKPKDIQVCPCTDAEEIITRCESCKICFDRSLANNNLVFKKH